ncbi:GNAT domain [Arabidopsis thaliana x Arabidopsis arenosa]|uniref:GCN5-related N-acetyltransferase 7, chloroplastic n=4 Tax=Arabidopsis TaxID=3701 RepID=GNAT7_ARATH|nr:Acyl-CoA N-acyltransferases (NAT) superfamily protein [Arabidopsis thaliana]Q94AC8.1 RecName: Full=GCN5-related N-acetyltransferase 7, chloroplastic; Flags: Precursor [Arabidopsis thaliana]KAG7617616.1 GNAT domain [Arabidopsis thaliana x Arabidopsis arenosa]KAG7622074.1 GNAT domain [Arabidopsis suecica]AAK82540.1 AT4g28030/T13J8_140 [Arabidopsis thaliana]AAM91394.1 At4g28030/T13J8_140 [Arabidopsis thaliana]AEE85424.1 Acyl-CoA N-acyltransferases (NAT) superfamily protein [Arabidopsis thalia|eukprot:NP_567795.1 Acyl-CoA N-acyltransferases (NAT) superfamily protein [Arabidopsis thaliana]
MAFLCSSLPSSSSIAIFGDPNTDGSSRSYLSIPSLKLRFRPVAASSHICAPAIDKSTFVISESVSEDELWAAACLRVRTFNELNPSAYNIQDHRRYLAEREFEALKERTSGKREGFTRVACINATLPLSQLSSSFEDLCSACKFSDGIEDRVVVGSLDLNQCRWLPDEIAGTKPEGIGVDFARAYLSNVCVAKELHRNGVGYKLIDKSKRVAGEWGITDMYVHVTVDNEAAKSLYMKSGFEQETAEPAWQARYLNRPQRLLLWLALPTSPIMSM